MDKRTAKALEASIAHWERNVAAETPEGAETGSLGCALCEKFFMQQDACLGCPVREHTGVAGCMRTPWSAAHSAVFWWEHRPSEETRSAWRAAAQRELDFLKSLRAEAKE